jgi:hypothetical protein
VQTIAPVVNPIDTRTTGFTEPVTAQSSLRYEPTHRRDAADDEVPDGTTEAPTNRTTAGHTTHRQRVRMRRRRGTRGSARAPADETTDERTTHGRRVRTHGSWTGRQAEGRPPGSSCFCLLSSLDTLRQVSAAYRNTAAAPSASRPSVSVLAASCQTPDHSKLEAQNIRCGVPKSSMPAPRLSRNINAENKSAVSSGTQSRGNITC